MVTTKGITQQPVQFSINATAPTRIGGMVAPYTLINGDVTGTIWLADNAGVRAGLGTPLHPGTSLLWTREGDFFAISEPTFTNTLIISDVEDWEPDPAAIAAAVLNAGILVIDNPEVLLSVSALGPGNIPATPIDISRFQSLNVSIELDVIAAAGEDNYVLLVFGDGGVTTYFLPLYFSAANQVWTASIPCYGDSFQVFIGTASDFDIFVSGSHRPIQTVRQRMDSITGIQVPVDLYGDSTTTVVTPGNSFFVMLPPWHGELEMDCRLQFAAAPGTAPTVTIQKQMRPNPFTWQPIRSFVPTLSAAFAFHIRERISVNGDALRFQFFNSGASVANMIGQIIRITPVSGAVV